MPVSPLGRQKSWVVVRTQAIVAALFLLGPLLAVQAYGQYPPPPPPPPPDQTAPANMPPGPPQGEPQGPPPMMAPQQLAPLFGRMPLFPAPLLGTLFPALPFGPTLH